MHPRQGSSTLRSVGWFSRDKPTRDALTLSPEAAVAHPLPAFALLRGGDLFDRDGGGRLGDRQAAEATVERRVRFERPASRRLVDRVRAELTRQLEGHRALAGRMASALPIHVDIVASAQEMAARGYPARAVRGAAGLFFAPRGADQGRIALRADALEAEGGDTLVVHEYAHAIQRLGFTPSEQDQLREALVRVFPHPADQAEAFAIYTERELMQREGFTKGEAACPGVYGACRRMWREEHVFAAFVKKLFRPGAPVRAGDGERRAADAWRRFSAG